MRSGTQTASAGSPGELNLRELKDDAGGVFCEYLFELGAKIRRVGIRIAD
jgi:hypothetical protein